MESKNYQSFSDLTKRAREETPPALDLRFAIRQQLETIAHQASEDWTQLLLSWASRARIRTGFCTALAALMFTAYWELSRPEPQAMPPMPTFMIDRFFSE